MRLPTEILTEIFNCLLPPYPHPNPTYTTPWSPIENILAIRSTCRSFRTIANNLPFWYDDRYNSIHFIPTEKDGRNVSNYVSEIYHFKFLKTLFNDAQLVQCLSRRKTWQFAHNSMLAAVASVPSFRDNTTTAHVDYYQLVHYIDGEYSSSPGAYLSATIAFLCTYPRLTTLSIAGPSELGFTLDLTTLATSCPSLKSLELDVDGIGTLRSLSNLQSLEVALDNVVGDGVIPVNSSDSITKLILKYWEPPFQCNNAVANGAFDSFVNLTSLFLHPLSNEICDFLIRANFSLKDFRTTATKEYGEDVDMRKVVNMLSSPSLSKLETLRIAFEPRKQWRPFYPQIVEQITFHLGSTLKELVIGMEMDTAWSSKFKRLVKLRRFLWYVPDENYDDILDIDDAHKAPPGLYESHRPAEYIKSRAKLNSDAEQQYMAAFDHSPDPPLVTFRILSWEEFCGYGEDPNLYDNSISFQDHACDDQSLYSMNNQSSAWGGLPNNN
jgi:hypothetical protein